MIGEGDGGGNGNGGGNGGGKDSEKFQYFYHPDHLGSSSYITDATGEVYQHLEYFAFGETFVEEHSNTHRTPYLFNGKELDEETGLYYYGARYYDAQTSVWLAVDPLAEKFPEWSPYNYAFNNPLRFIDPTGMEGEDVTDPEKLKQAANNAVNKATEIVGNTTDAACNIGVCSAFTEVTGSNELDGLNANEMVDYVNTSDSFEKIEISEAQTLANNGEFVLAGKKESNGSGHVVMVVPGEEVNSGSWGGKVPVVMDTGANKRSSKKGINYSWSGKAKEGVSFYRYKDSPMYEGGTLNEVVINAPRTGNSLQPIKPTIQSKKIPSINILLK